jgi:hypothetical protein
MITQHEAIRWARAEAERLVQPTVRLWPTACSISKT